MTAQWTWHAKKVIAAASFLVLTNSVLAVCMEGQIKQCLMPDGKKSTMECYAGRWTKCGGSPPPVASAIANTNPASGIDFDESPQSQGGTSAKRTRSSAYESQFAQEAGAGVELSSASFSGYCTYRFAGSRIVRCTDPRITPYSRIFASISEYTNLGPSDRIVGAARMTMHNIRPFWGGVDMWTNVEWASPLNIRMDLLVDP